MERSKALIEDDINRLKEKLLGRSKYVEIIQNFTYLYDEYERIVICELFIFEFNDYRTSDIQNDGHYVLMRQLTSYYQQLLENPKNYNHFAPLIDEIITKKTVYGVMLRPQIKTLKEI